MTVTDCIISRNATTMHAFLGRQAQMPQYQALARRNRAFSSPSPGMARWCGPPPSRRNGLSAPGAGGRCRRSAPRPAPGGRTRRRRRRSRRRPPRACAPRRALTRSLKASCTSACRLRRWATSSGRSGLKGSSIDFDSPAVWTRRSTPELGDGLDEAEARRDDPDRADDRAFIGIDLVARAGQPVAARGRDILAEDDDGQLVLVRQLADAGVDQGRLHGRAAGRIDADGHGGEPLAG